MRPAAASLLLALSACAVALGQVPPRATCEVLLRDGRRLSADTIAVAAGGALRLQFGNEVHEVPRAEVLSVQGTACQASSLPAAVLAGGDVVRGLLVGGDGQGDSFELASPVLGRLRLPVDRLDALVLRPDLARAGDLQLPDGADEAVFVKAQLGFDRIVGAVHQFGEPGIRFQPNGQPEPRWFSVRDLVGLRLAGSSAAAKPPVAELTTRTGDRVGLLAIEFAGATVQATLESGAQVALPLSDVGALVLLDGAAIQLSGLPLQSAVEAAHDGDVLLPWQKDLAVTAAPMAADGRCYGRGFGVHSRSRLLFRVPDGAGAFVAHVALDDSAGQLAVRGAVDVAVRLDDAAVFAQKSLRAGAAPVRIGPLAVRPGQTLSLEVDFGLGRDLGDRVDWLMPVFLPSLPVAPPAK